MTATTIKVPTALRDRINRGAKERGVTAAAYLAHVLDHVDRAQRMKAVGEAFSRLTDTDDYWDEVRAWDDIAAGPSRD